MVLLPKQWKSRSSPGFEASVRRESPFAISFKAAAGSAERRLCYFELSRSAARFMRVDVGLVQCRGVEQPGSSSGS